MSHLNELENEGLIVHGRIVSSKFENVEAIEKAATFVDQWAAKLRLRLSFIYCGTTINWPDDFEYTSSIIGPKLTKRKI